MRTRARRTGQDKAADRSSAAGGDRPRRLYADSGVPDRVFRGVATSGGGLVLVVMLLVGGFLFYRAWKALQKAGWAFFTTAEWEPDSGHFGITAVLVGTCLIALVAIVVAVPLAIGTALYISEYAPQRLRRTLVSIVDLMAAVPSVVYGLWGLFFLQGKVIGLARWISTYFGWIPPFHVDGADPHDPLATATVYTASTFVAGLVVAMMVTPIICSIIREVFSQAPVGEREGAYALGATRWGVIRSVVLPFGTGGMIGGTMLGLGRALGETIGVYMVISPLFKVQFHIFQSGTSSVSSLIALRYGDAGPLGMSALMAAGLALFLMTLVVNFAASSIVARSRSGATAE
ncbi:phosphate ABC transporter permease subunit PstC [Actinacidiphila bryophytorum]|jgi:phosphate transport system permease protein|uniref:phosphate ABC transporter permease subunit PstC n=1 Tax=Actinacidiphila bryophytorum TaxID=1436133 RepID=UPI002176E32A|nr:phosphate ABC transporter permease subunit PstC [Actinacidiphila bryophytorum]UWE13998.1 phosphate ABC transporter permease subunit PstC [Actinacidiphila bryophytorum]